MKHRVSDGKYVGLIIPPEHQGCKEEGKQDNASQHNASNEQLAFGTVICLALCSCCPCGRLVCLQGAGVQSKDTTTLATIFAYDDCYHIHTLCHSQKLRYLQTPLHAL